MSGIGYVYKESRRYEMITKSVMDQNALLIGAKAGWVKNGGCLDGGEGL